MLKKTFRLMLGALLLVAAAPGMSAVSAAEAARLGADLTPLGGEKAGNKAGTIPAWDGGLTSAAKCRRPGVQGRRPSSGSVRGRQAAVHDHAG